jgi:hypothetical protein
VGEEEEEAGPAPLASPPSSADGGPDRGGARARRARRRGAQAVVQGGRAGKARERMARRKKEGRVCFGVVFLDVSVFRFGGGYRGSTQPAARDEGVLPTQREGVVNMNEKE